MHYFKRNIGDYHKKAGRLSMLQHGAYTLIMDACYDREEFPTLEQAIDWSWASNQDEIDAVTFVLGKFFTLVDGVYVQNRIQDDLDRYHKNSKTNKRIAIDREAKRKEKSTKRAQDVNEAPPNHKPLTTNHKPIQKTCASEDTPKPDKIDFVLVAKKYNETFPNLRQVKLNLINDKRKRAIKKLFKLADMDLKKWGNYLNAISTKESCQWMLQERPNQATGQTWRAKDFDYFITESCYIKVKEG